MIRPLIQSDIAGLNLLPPLEWKFDYEAFLQNFINEDFFRAVIFLKDQKIVGTGNIFVKGEIGWLGNIIVDEKYRGQGIGYAITQEMVDFLANSGCATQLLIATKMGEPVYQKLGFRKIGEYQSFDSRIDRAYTPIPSIRNLSESDFSSVAALDKEINDEDRTHMLQKFYQHGVGYFAENNELLGFYLPEFGQGLVLSKEKGVGKALLELKHETKGKTTLLPIENQHGITVLKNMGIHKGGKCARMILGRENNWQPNHIYSYGSGYCG
jgi:GNAT superfamily N-acetyltransferase